MPFLGYKHDKIAYTMQVKISALPDPLAGFK